MPEPTRVKICGITDTDTAALCADLGVWAIGMVFVPGTPRNIDPADARRVAGAVPDGVARVGLFVEPEVDDVVRTVGEVGLTHVQLHGTVDVAAVAKATGCATIESIPVDGAASIDRAHASSADLILLDASVEGRHGGTGQRFDWSLIEPGGIGRPYLLAGGLTPGNVGDAIALLHPPYVDVSSGVERERGVKDHAMIRAFVAAVREASPVGSAR